MRKICSAVWIMVLSMVSLAASAQDNKITLHIHVDNPQQVKVLDPASSYYNKIYLDFDSNNDVSLSVAKEDAYFDIEAAPGFLVSSIKDATGSSLAGDDSRLPSTDYRFYFSKYEYGEGYMFLPEISDGMLIDISTEVRPSATYSFKGNPDQIKSVTYDGDSYSPDSDGVWSVKVFAGSNSVKVESGEGFRLRSITDTESGDAIAISGKTTAYISCAEIDGDKNFEIVSYPIEEDRTAAFTLNVKSGLPSDISLQMSGSYKDLPLSDELTQVVRFDPETESYFTVSHSNYRNELYKVVLDGEALSDSYGTFRFEAKDGSVLDVYAAFPEVRVPVRFSFTNEDTEGFIRYIEVNDERIDDGSWLDEDFSLMMGDELYIKFNTDEYDWDTIEVNGEELYSAYFNRKITEESYDIVITASRIGTTKVTVKCDVWDKISLEGYDTVDFTLTGPVTEIEVPSNESKIKVKPAEGYVVYDVYDEATGESLYDGRYFYGWTDGMTIVIDAAEFVRDQTVMVYLEDCEWGNSYFYIANNTDLEKKITLDPGYNEVAFGYGDFDDALFRLNLPDYSDGVVYLNGEILDWAGFSLIGIDQVQDGDVIKIFSEEKDTYLVSYDIADDVKVEVRHDYIVGIKNPSEHKVLPGTAIHIQPAVKDADSSILVMVNGKELAPEENGIYTVTADEDKDIRISLGQTTGVNGIYDAAAGRNNVYDTMGKTVLRNASSRDLKALPAGIYIIGNRKVVVR